MEADTASSGSQVPHNVLLHQLLEVVGSHQLEFLSLTDLFRLRLTSGATKSWATTALGSKAHLCIEINGTGPLSFESALNTANSLGLNIHQLYINTESEDIYNGTSAQNFISIYGPHLRKLKLKSYMPNLASQVIFLLQLHNVKELSIELMKLDEETCRPDMLSLPPFFNHLKVLKFGRIEIDETYAYDPDDEEAGTEIWYRMIMRSARLNHLRYPRILFDSDNDPEVSARIKFECLKRLISEQRILFPADAGHWLSSIDLKHLDDIISIEFELHDFIQFVYFLKDKGVELLNVNAAYIENVPTHRFPGGDPRLQEFDCISSLVDYSPAVSCLPLTRLEEITIASINMATSTTSMSWNCPVSNWVSLKSIRLHFDLLEEDILESNHYVMALLKFLFLIPGRSETVKKLKISFDPELLAVVIPQFVLPAKYIVEGLSGLTKLTLSGWNPNNGAFIRLWLGLPLLEELWLESCLSLGNVAIIGGDQENPAFLNLKRLVTLTLVMDRMPKITERAFKDVFRHMALRRFSIRSEGALGNVTKGGILWLLDGQFAKTVEHFSFDSWSSVHITQDEMMDLKARFKSLLM